MRRKPETIRAFLLRTTALYSNTVPLPETAREGASQTFSIYRKGKQVQKMELKLA